MRLDFVPFLASYPVFIAFLDSTLFVVSSSIYRAFPALSLAYLKPFPGSDLYSSRVIVFFLLFVRLI